MSILVWRQWLGHLSRGRWGEPRFGRRGINVQVMPGGVFGDAEQMVVGDHVYIGPEAYFWAVGGLQIDDSVIIGPRVTILTSNHRYEGGEALPYDGVTILEPVHICTNVWIGAQALIAPGVTVHEGAVVGMGSVVTRDVPALAVVGGNPAVVLKYRPREEYERLKREGRSYLALKAAGRVEYRTILRRPEGT